MAAGLMRVVSNEEIMEKDRRDLETERLQNSPVILSLASHLGRQWQAARQAKERIERRLLSNLRQRRGEYDPDKLAAIQEMGGSQIYMMLTSYKVRTIVAWIEDIMFQPGEKPWSLSPTTIPEIPPEIEAALAEYVNSEAMAAMQQGATLTQEMVNEKMEEVKDELKKRVEEEAKERGVRMEDVCWDQMQEGKWEDTLREFIEDVATFPAAFLRGPVLRKDKQLSWEVVGGKTVPKIETKLIPEFKRVSPFDFYPAPNARRVGDGYQFERHRLRRKALLAMKGVPGFNDKAIDQALDTYGMSGHSEWLWRDQERANLEDRDNEWLNSEDNIDALEYFGSVPGRMLREWGMSEEQIPDKNEEYEVNCWMIGHIVIKATLNEDPLDRRNYFSASLEKIPGSLWGNGAPDIIRDIQNVINAAARSLVNNMALASGPQAELHADRLAQNEDVTDIKPWKIWQTKSDPNGTNNPAVRFFNIDPMSDMLLRVYEYFDGLADQYLGVPSYVGGDASNKGAAKTASGLSMLMTAASRGIKQVIGHVDKVVRGTVEGLYYYNMITHEDESIKGDLKIVARGTSSLIAKEQQMVRRTEFLATTNNPVDMGIIGAEGRAAVLRESVKSMDIPVDDVVPNKQAIMQKAKEAMMAEIQAQGGGGAGMPGAGREIDTAGNPVSGQDTALFNAG